MSVYESSITNPKKQLEFYKDLSEQLQVENKQLKKQLEEYQKELEKADSITQSCIFNGKEESKISYRKCLNMLEKHKNQQKEFIEYLEDCINELKKESMNKLENTISLGIADVTKTILSKYKSIIGCDKSE